MDVPRQLLGRTAVIGVAACALALPLTGAAWAGGGTGPHTERVSVAADGTQAAGASYTEGVSADGRYVVFTSAAANLVPGDTNGVDDVFIKDLRTKKVERVSVATGGAQADSRSSGASVSADGRYVAFNSDAANLAPGDDNGSDDVFVRDRHTGRTERVSVGTATGPQLYNAWMPTISADGRVVAYASRRADLVPGDTNNVQDIFAYDRSTHTTRRVSVASDGTQADGPSAGPVISADGRHIAFVSRALNLDPGTPVRKEPRGASVAKPREYPSFIHDLRTGRTRALSVSSAGETSGGSVTSLSADGRYAVFHSYWPNLVPQTPTREGRVYLRDLREGTTTLESLAGDGSQANSASYGGKLADHGRLLFFHSSATNLVPGDTNNAGDVFVRDLRTGRVELVSLANDDSQSTTWTDFVSVDAAGRIAAFDSDDSHLVVGDTNGAVDVFVRHVEP
ncbi:TolB family protein [Streptomyces sp. NPDC057654]|uniref:TolB family protein n=1 Tax=Streptomyces sp. NPDC057654 TaxID=3346196 RepID=UPI003694387E